MDLEEIDAKIAELQALKAQAEAKRQEEINRANFEEAREIYPRLLADLKRLGEIGFVPRRLIAPLSESDGTYNPGIYIKSPKVTKPQE